MTTSITSARPSKPPAPAPSAFTLCDDASCALERLTILLDTTTEALRVANDEMPVGEGKDRAHYEVFCLLLLLHDNMTAHRDAIDAIQASIVAERKAA
jgi:hypothetical protein